MNVMELVQVIRDAEIDLNQDDGDLWWDIIEAADFSLATGGTDFASKLIDELMRERRYYTEVWEDIILPALKYRRAVQRKTIDPFRVIYILRNYYPGKHSGSDEDMIEECLLPALGLYHHRWLPEEVVAYLKAEDIYPEAWLEKAVENDY